MSQQVQGIGFPSLVFQQPTSFYEPPSFISPELSARMENTIKTSKLNDFKVGARPSLTTRNKDFQSSFSQQQKGNKSNQPFRKYMNSVDEGPVKNLIQNSARNSLMNKTSESYKSGGVQRNEFVLKGGKRNGSMNQTSHQMTMNSTARDTQQNNQFQTSYLQISGHQHNIRVQGQQKQDLMTLGADTISSIGEPAMGQTAQQWLKEGAFQGGYKTTQNEVGPKRKSLRDTQQVSTAGSISKSAAMRLSIEEGRPSIMSESCMGSNLVATRVPYKQSQHAQLNMLQTRQDFQVGAREELSTFSLGQKTPMSPGERQRQTMDKIQFMGLKARGKLQPGQPTAKQYAEQVKRAKLEGIPSDYGEKTAFVHNSSNKPITAYRFNKFKELHKMRGIELDNRDADSAFAEQMKKKRSAAQREKVAYEKQKTRENIINFKGNGVDLYSAEDKARLAQGLKPNQGSDYDGSSVDKSDTISQMTSSTVEDNPSRRMTKLESTLQAQLNATLNQNDVDTNLNRRADKKYDLYGSERTKDKFLVKLQKKIKAQPPGVNISEIVDQFYNKEKVNGHYVAKVESSAIIFQKTLEREKNNLFDLGKVDTGKAVEPTFHLTRDTLPTPMRSIAEENVRGKSPKGRKFTLNKYHLNELQQSYKAYKEVHERVVYAAKEVQRYKKMKDAEVLRITEHQIVSEIRQNPQLEKVALTIEDPLAHALIRMLITYEKYNYETEQVGIEQSINHHEAFQGEDDIFSVSNSEPPFKEIELMQELVLEIGEAINDRIKEGNDGSPMKKEIGSPKAGDRLTNNDGLYGQAFGRQAKKNTYLTIDKFIADHPEFSEIKDEAKKKVLDRVTKYRQSTLQEESSPVMKTSSISKYENQISEPASPASPFFQKALQDPDRHNQFASGNKNDFTQVSNQISEIQASSMIEKQKNISMPRRKSKPKRGKVSLQSFVQSNHFTNAFTEVIQTLDNNYNKRKNQNNRASYHINKQVFYKLAKESITNNAAENPNISYMNNCYNEKVMPFPIFSKIRGNTLKLVRYNLNEGYCNALEKFLSKMSAEEFLVEKLILHGNNCIDASFAAILRGLIENSRLRHLHYSLNEFGHYSNQALLQLLQMQPPNQLKSLCLQNIKTSGKNLKPEQRLAEPEDDSKIQAFQEYYFKGEKLSKGNIVHDLTVNILHTESLLKLVLADLPMGDKAQKNLVLFAENNSKLENFQLINCQMFPEYLAQICTFLKDHQGLQSLSFRKNVLRNSKSKILSEFTEALINLIENAAALMHLDIGGMYIGDSGINQIMCDGVAISKTLAAVHFQDNQVSNWTRLRIFGRLTMGKKSHDEEGGNAGVSTPNSSKHKELEQRVSVMTNNESVNISEENGSQLANVHSANDIALHEARVGENLINRRRGEALDVKLDNDEINQNLLIKNINELVKANMPIISFPESQMIIDDELLKQTKNETSSGDQMQIMKGGISDDLRGTLYNRVSFNPELYQDRVEREKYFANSKWLSISYHTGCWICNASKIIDRVNKKNQITFMHQSNNNENRATSLYQDSL